jgi:multiple sugar transport system substrate-binding protein
MWSQKTGIPVDVTAVPGPEGLDRTMAEFVAKSKAYDLMPLFSPWLPSVGMFPEDLKPWVEKYGFDLKIFPQPLLEGATWKGRLVCLPFRQSTTIFYYRKDLYEELRLSVPKTLDELVDNAIALTDPNKNRYGWGMIMTYPGHWVDVVSPLALALGARLLEPPDQTTIAPFDPNGIVFQEIFRAFRKMYEKGCSPAGMTTWTWSECLSGLQSGLIAQSHTVTARVPLLEDPSKSQTAGKWDYVILRDFFKPMGNYPQKSSSLFMWGIAMNQWISDKRKEVAFNALQFVVSREAQLEGLKYANDPCRLDVLNSEEFKKINKAWQLNIKGLNDLYDDARHPKSAEIQKYVVDASHAALLGKKTPEEAAKELWKNVSEALAK